MKKNDAVEIISIGREILDGRVIDTNSIFLAEQLKSVGLTPRFGQRVDDEIDRVVESFQIASKRASIVLVTGGLGPTSDDLTAEAFAKFLNISLVRRPEAVEMIEARFKKIGRPLLPIQYKQADLPANATILENDLGTAPGFAWLPESGAQFFFMPGVPLEMKNMFLEKILPKLPQNKNMKSATWVTQFTSEGKLQEELTEITKELPKGFEISYRTRFPENHIGLYADCSEVFLPQNAEAFARFSKKITAILGKDAFEIAVYPKAPRLLEEVVIDLLKEKKIILTTSESCTGGLIAHRITSISGSSKVFWGGVVCYENSVKTDTLGVPRELLRKHGAVSAEVAASLAEGALLHLKKALTTYSKEKDWALPEKPEKLFSISTTGIAGPSGGSKDKPVGLCYIALAIEGKPTETLEIRAPIHLDRERNKVLFAQHALNLVRERIL